MSALRKMAVTSTQRIEAEPSMGAEPGQSVVDLERYVPAYFTWIANKLSGGASQA